MVRHNILVKGSNFKFAEGTIGFANLVLVEAADVLILFDTGHYGNRRTLLQGLAAAGYQPSDIGAVVLSHLHYDHSVNVNLFPRARVYLSEKEWAYAAKPHAEDHTIPWKIRDLLAEFDVTRVEESLEITPGVNFFLTPGHTPGSASLALDTEQGTVVLAGDAIKYPKEVLLRRSDMAYDGKAHARASIEAILERADVIVPGHFGELRRQGRDFVWEEDSALTIVSR